MAISSDPGLWIAAALIVLVWSYLYKETVLYRFAEHTFIGVAAGVTTAFGIKQIIDIAGRPVVSGANYLPIVSILLGILLYARFFKQYAHLGRYMLGIIVGVGTGISLRAAVDSNFVVQIRATVAAPLTNANAFVSLAALLSVLFYFIFSVKQEKGASAIIAKIGRYFMMIAMGNMFGGAIMGRISLMIGSLQMILYDLLGLLPK